MLPEVGRMVVECSIGRPTTCGTLRRVRLPAYEEMAAARKHGVRSDVSAIERDDTRVVAASAIASAIHVAE